MAGREQNQACSWPAWKLFLWLHQRPRFALKLKTENSLRLRDWYLSFYNHFLSCNGECSILHIIILLHMTCGHCHFSHNSTLEGWTLPPLKHLDNMKDVCPQRRFFYWSTNAHTPSSLTSNTILCLLLETSSPIPVIFISITLRAFVSPSSWKRPSDRHRSSHRVFHCQDLNEIKRRKESTA